MDEAPLHMLTQRDKIHMSLEEAIQEMAQRYQDLKAQLSDVDSPSQMLPVSLFQARGKLSDKDLGTEPPVSKL